MEFAYSTRFKRCRSGAPGVNLALAASSRVIRSRRRPEYVAASGRGFPAGGIAPSCSFFTTFSQVSGSAETSSGFPSSDNPAVLARLLWQPVQYLLIVVCCQEDAATPCGPVTWAFKRVVM